MWHPPWVALEKPSCSWISELLGWAPADSELALDGARGAGVFLKVERGRGYISQQARLSPFPEGLAPPESTWGSSSSSVPS